MSGCPKIPKTTKNPIFSKKKSDSIDFRFSYVFLHLARLRRFFLCLSVCLCICRNVRMSRIPKIPKIFKKITKKNSFSFDFRTFFCVWRALGAFLLGLSVCLCVWLSGCPDVCLCVCMYVGMSGCPESQKSPKSSKKITKKNSFPFDFRNVFFCVWRASDAFFYFSTI